MRKLLMPLLALLMLSACGVQTPGAPEEDAYSSEVYAMTTLMNLTAYGEQAQPAVQAAVAEINRLDKLLTVGTDFEGTGIQTSGTGDIVQLNSSGSAEVSQDTVDLISRAVEIGDMTDGLFDCTIGPVMEAWGFTDQNYRVPDPELLAGLMANVDYSRIQVEGKTVTVPEGVKVDLGGIAKGFASSRVMEIFADNGVTSGLITLGGNVQSIGTKPDGTLWKVGIQDPNDATQIIGIIDTADEAVITSGGYERFFEDEDGNLWHHIIDPRTGYSSSSGLTSVTIVSADGTLADALSTALFIMGPEQASAFWKKHSSEFQAVMLQDDGTVLVTAGLAERLTLSEGYEEVVIDE